MANKGSKKSKYSDEISKIKQLKIITKVLERGDVENAFLNSADKDSEGIQDIAVERMLNDLKLGGGSDNEAKIIDAITSSPKNASRKKGSAKPKAAKKSSKNKRK